MISPFLRPEAGGVRLLEGIALQKQASDRAYLMRLTDDNLLLHYRQEAGLINDTKAVPSQLHWGWDGPFSQIRGTFTGHWLSAAAHLVRATGDGVLKARADGIVSEIARCQRENGGEWAFSIPEKHLVWLSQGKRTWAPLYVCHKTMMGLLDMYRLAGNEQALEVLQGCARWFTRFTQPLSRDTLNEMMDQEETGGLMELWADLYAVTGEEAHLTLMRRYERPLLYEKLLAGEDPLTNQHANTTIPEMLGVARAYEVTGEARYRQIVEAYWRWAVTNRGCFATGGQTSGEIWTPPGQQAARLSDTNQEHCTVYHLMRLSEYLFRWTGDSQYADYWERNLINGVFSQCFVRDESFECRCEPYPPAEGIVSYYQPLMPGGQKRWGGDTDQFWCCYCTAVQACASLNEGVLYTRPGEVWVAQYQPVEALLTLDGRDIRLRQTPDEQTGENVRVLPISHQVLSRPNELRMRLEIGGGGATFALKLRAPWWMQGKMKLWVNGEPVEAPIEGGFAVIERIWADDVVVVSMGKRLSTWPLPDRPDCRAFLDGPVTLCALTDQEVELVGDPDHPEQLLEPDDERRWTHWRPFFHTVGQPRNLRLLPLYLVRDQKYTVYFPFRKRD